MEKKTVVLVPYGKSARDHHHGDCIDKLKTDFGTMVLEIRQSPQIDMARSELACAALAYGADVAFFIDSDILFQPEDVERLADSARETLGVVGAPYSKRALGAGVVGSFAPDVSEVTFYEGGGLYVATGHVGMGFTAIHRSVFEKLDEQDLFALCNSSTGPLRPYFQKRIVGGYWMHEDASFCYAAREAGMKTHIDTRLRVKHVGERAFGVEDCRVQIPDLRTMTLKVREQ